MHNSQVFRYYPEDLSVPVASFYFALGYPSELLAPKPGSQVHKSWLNVRKGHTSLDSHIPSVFPNTNQVSLGMLEFTEGSFHLRMRTTKKGMPHSIGFSNTGLD